MELLTPGPFLILWQLIALSTAILFFISWGMILSTNKLAAESKMTWLIGTLFLPIVGPILFFVKFRAVRKSHL